VRYGASASAVVLVIALTAVVTPHTASAAVTAKKAIWGPVEVGGVSQFPIYRELGAGIYQYALSWPEVAPSPPQHPRDPRDPAYQWPNELDVALREATSASMRVSVLITHAPGWANGGKDKHWAPIRPEDFADFAAAASRRYPGVRYWLIWGEPSKVSRFMPLAPAMGRKLTPRQLHGPRLYARILDASYRALKRQARRDLVIGGNTWTGGEVVPLNFLKAMRLPSGRRPRMDLYGHNPFTLREPNLANRPLRFGMADFSDLDTLTQWLGRYGYRDSRNRRLRVFISEFVLPTDHASLDFNFWLSLDTQAKWLERALRITRRFSRIYTLGYLGLYDDPPRPDGLQVNRGLIDQAGHRKPAFWVFQRG
jgi:hypothetical protein